MSRLGSFPRSSTTRSLPSIPPSPLFPSILHNPLLSIPPIPLPRPAPPALPEGAGPGGAGGCAPCRAARQPQPASGRAKSERKTGKNRGKGAGRRLLRHCSCVESPAQNPNTIVCNSESTRPPQFMCLLQGPGVLPVKEGR